MSDIGLPVREHEIEPEVIPHELEEVEVPEEQEEKELVPVPAPLPAEVRMYPTGGNARHHFSGPKLEG